MNDLRKNRIAGLAAALLATAFAVHAARGPGWLDPGASVQTQRGREALFRKEYAVAVRLCSAVYLSDPANKDARLCLRDAAAAGAAEDVRAVQKEGEKIKKRALTRKSFEDFTKQHLYLESYALLYEELEADHLDAWVRGQIEKLQQMAGESLSDGLKFADERYRNALQGFHFLGHKNAPGMRRAREHWGEALKLKGGKIPEGRIRRYLSWLECYDAGSESSCSSMAEYKELRELFQ